RGADAYAWAALEGAGAHLAFGSDAPVASPDPLLGVAAATRWRHRVGWHPELALTRSSALRAYSAGAAYAVGMEDDLGELSPGRLCDVTVVERGAVTATLVGGRLIRGL
ncbi:MAG: amidohydrolase family protein, partial [Candidatus Dormibacteraceae bacterium]